MSSGHSDYSALQQECPPGFAKVCEGSAAVLFPPAMVRAAGSGEENKDASPTSDVSRRGPRVDDGVPEDQAVFYNPAQVVNRDLSTCALELFSRLRRDEPRRRGGTKAGITVLEALSATGLRAIRYFKEVSQLRYVIANDLDADAVDCIRRNCRYNNVPCAAPSFEENLPSDTVVTRAEEDGGGILSGGAVIPNLDDANDLMHRLAVNPAVRPQQRVCAVSRGVTPPAYTPLLQQELMDVVDLDPYGSVSPFLEAAFGCIKEGGMMLVTSTDSPVLCGNHLEAAHGKYNSILYKGSHCHEMAVRAVLAAVERVANKHRKYVVPLVSLHIDFYVRCLFRVYTQSAEVKLSPSKLGYQLQCTQCPAFWVRPLATARPPRPSRRTKRRRGAAADDGAGAEDASCRQHPSASPTRECTSQPRETFPPSPAYRDDPKLACMTMQKLQATPSSGTACPVCGAAVSVSGPIYCAPTQNREFLTQLREVIAERDAAGRLTAAARINGLVCAALDELPQCPLFYLLPDIASVAKVRCPSTPQFVAALGRLGYRCSQVHCAPTGIKTDCPPDVLMRVMLQWKVLQEAEDAAAGVHTPSAEHGNGPHHAAPRQTPELLVIPLAEADFTYDKQYDFRSQATGVAKFVPNAPGWGPKRRHQGAQPASKEMDTDAQ